MGARGIAIHHALVTDLATGNAHALGRPRRILVTLGALLHLGNADILDRLRVDDLTVARIAANLGALAILYVVPMREAQALGNHHAASRNTQTVLHVTACAVGHGKDLLGFALVALGAGIVTRQHRVAGLRVARVAVVAAHMKADTALHIVRVEVRLV